MKNKLFNKYFAILIMATALISCKEEGHNVAKLKEGKQPGITYAPLTSATVDSKDKISFSGNLVSMDGIKEVSAYFIEVLALNSYGNPSSEGNKFFIGADKINDKQNNTIFNGDVTVTYNGQDKFKTGNNNPHAKYTLNGKLDLSKYKLVPGKRYRLSINFITYGNMPTLESPLMFVVNK